MNTKIRKERILVIQPYGIGDTLFMLPFLKALKDQMAVERIDCIIGPRTKPIMENCPAINDIFVVDKDKWKAQSKWTVFLEKCCILNILRRRHYTLFADFSMQPEYSFWAKFYLRIPVRAGFNYKNRNKFLTHPLSLPIEGFKDRHVIEYYADLAKMFGLRIEDKRPSFNIPVEASERVRQRLSEKGYQGGRILVLAPGGGETWGRDARRKQWPVDSFRELAEMVKGPYDISFVVVVGSQKERDLGEYLKMGLSIPSVDLCGETSLIESAAAIKMSSLFIGNDGGLSHIAFAQRIPSVALYGPADPNVYGPLPEHKDTLGLSKKLSCQPCYVGFRYRKDCSRLSCLLDLSPQEVFSRLISSKT